MVTDGQIDEDRYAQCVDDVRQPTMTYTSNMTGDYYDAGTEIYKDDTDWSSGVAAVYDGDDWQESVADFVINLVCCRFCRKAPEEFEAV